MMLSLAVLGTAAALAGPRSTPSCWRRFRCARDRPISPTVDLVLADILIFVAFGAYKIQGLVLDPLDTIVEQQKQSQKSISSRVQEDRPHGEPRLARSMGFAGRRASSRNRRSARSLEKVAKRRTTRRWRRSRDWRSAQCMWRLRTRSAQELRARRRCARRGRGHRARERAHRSNHARDARVRAPAPSHHLAHRSQRHRERGRPAPARSGDAARSRSRGGAAEVGSPSSSGTRPEWSRCSST